MQNSLVSSRLKDMLSVDKKSNPIKLENVIKSEIVYLLKNYMELNSNDVDFTITLDNDNKYNIVFTAKVDRLKQLNFIV